jgi:hypothetical protein
VQSLEEQELDCSFIDLGTLEVECTECGSDSGPTGTTLWGPEGTCCPPGLMQWTTCPAGISHGVMMSTIDTETVVPEMVGEVTMPETMVPEDLHLHCEFYNRHREPSGPTDTDTDTDPVPPTPTDVPTKPTKIPEKVTTCCWGTPQNKNGKFSIKTLRIEKGKTPEKILVKEKVKVLGSEVEVWSMEEIRARLARLEKDETGLGAGPLSGDVPAEGKCLLAGVTKKAAEQAGRKPHQKQAGGRP